MAVSAVKVVALTTRTSAYYSRLTRGTVPTKFKDVPIWCFHGDKDGAVPVTRSRDMVAAIKAVGGTKILYREYPGVGHGCWNATYRDDAVLKWFFAQRKPAK